MPRKFDSPAAQNIGVSFSTSVSFPVLFINNMQLNEDIPCPGAGFSAVASALARFFRRGFFCALRNVEHAFLGKLKTLSLPS